MNKNTIINSLEKVGIATCFTIYYKKKIIYIYDNPMPNKYYNHHMGI